MTSSEPTELNTSPDGDGVTLMEVNRFVGLKRARPDIVPIHGRPVAQETPLMSVVGRPV
jgi:hypothetical protein